MSDLYGTDFLLWTERQAQLLREHATCDIANRRLDWPSLAEAIESIGASQKSQTEQNPVTRCQLT
jgi:hypothetical protein